MVQHVAMAPQHFIPYTSTKTLLFCLLLLSNFKSHLLLLLINIFQKLHPPRSPQKDSRREDRDQSKSVERNISMAKFTAQGLRLTFNGDRAPFGCELREQVRFSGRRIHDRPASIHKIGRGLRSPPDAAGKVWSLGRRSGSSKAEECVREVMDDDDDDEYEDDQEREGEEEGEFERDELSCFRGLVLDISYRPVNVVCWKRAICLEFMEKADVLEYYDQTISSPRGSFYIPAVLRVPHLLQVVKRRRIKQQLSRKNILYRDNFICQYCSSRQNLTIDHVLPICRGGEWKWENLVTACASCNSRKGQKTLVEANMKLMKTPKAPKEYDILAIPLTSAAIRMLKIRKGVPEEWLQYLPKQSP